MREELDFRISERKARDSLPDDRGERLGGTVRRIRVAIGDPLVEQIRRLDREFRERGEVFFASWDIQRHYSRRDIEEATLVHVRPKTAFEPAGEECGTVYDETAACDHVFEPESETGVSGYRVPLSGSTCGAGARQVTPLHLDARRIPRQVDFAQTIAGEVVASARACRVFLENGLVGAAFEPVRESNAGATLSSAWFQLNVVGSPVELAAATRAGESPFDDVGYGRCPRGHTVGLNLLSEVTVKGVTVPKADVMATRQMVGTRVGLLRPRPMLLLSPRAWRAIDDEKLKGLVVEVAHLS